MLTRVMEGRKKQKSTKCDTEKEQTPTELDLQSLLTNSIVAENVVSFMSLEDMKAVSEVSGQLLQAIRGTRRFNRKAVLKVTEESLEDLQHLESSENHVWRCVKLDLRLGAKVPGIVSRLLESAQFVALVSMSPLRDNMQIHHTAMLRWMQSVLSGSPNLTHLQVDIRMMNRNYKNVFSLPAVQTTLKNLRQLDILEINVSTPGSFIAHHGPSFFVDEEKEGKLNNFAKNFLQLAELPLRLESFNLTRVTSRGEGNSFTDSVVTILKSSSAKLKELSVHRDVWKLDDLETLTVTVDVEGQAKLARFLKNHPRLEELDVEGRPEFDRSMLSAIKQHCGQLKKLHIKAMELLEFTGEEGAVDWTFLGDMKQLKDFRIARSDFDRYGEIEEYGTGPRFLSALPKNQLESLSLKAICSSKLNLSASVVCFFAGGANPYCRGFWKGSDLEGEEPELLFKTDLLLGFTCLRRLSVLKCHNFFDDGVMQFVLKEFRLLEELELSDCVSLTDAGITGVSTAEWSLNASISDLRGLKKLVIRKCSLVTQKGLLSCITFPHLKEFTYSYSTFDQIPQSFVLKIAEQNPSLETIALGAPVYIGQAEDEGDFQKELKKNFPRLTVLDKKRIYSIEVDSDVAFEHGDNDPRNRYPCCCGSGRFA